MANPQSQYYPHAPGGPFLASNDYPGVPRVRHTNFDTTQVLADRVRRAPIFQGVNEQEMQGYIQNEINYAHTNAIGLKSDFGVDAVNRAADVFDGHAA